MKNYYVPEGTLLWEPSDEFKNNSNMKRYMDWLKSSKGLDLKDYQQLWEWSVENLEDFWESIWNFYSIKASKGYERVLEKREMPKAKWFPGAKLNFAEHIFRAKQEKYPALIFKSERHSVTHVSWDELEEKSAAFSQTLREIGVKAGDRVVAFMPNIPETVMAFLAASSIGAIWSSCSPDFGTKSVIDRFKQIEPKVLIAADGYQYGGKPFDKRKVIEELQEALPTVEKTILVPYLNPKVSVSGLKNTMLWKDAISSPGKLEYEQLPFEHPLWVLYSSGTTGPPKAIVHSQGGILVEMLKFLGLHGNLKPGDKFFWFTTTGWMLWNVVVSALLHGSTAMLYDGNPAYPDLSVVWKYAEETGMHVFGTSAAYILACMRFNFKPKDYFKLEELVSIGSTASYLPPEGFKWVYEEVKKDVWLVSGSGGTDICSAFFGGNPMLPVYAGEMQCICLGVNAKAYDDEGNPVIDKVGELVVTDPMPSMPVFFWGDKNDEKYKESYFSVYPGVWRHGDRVKITSRGTAIIYGRSDSTLNRQGIRIGTAEIYRVVEDMEEIADSLVVGIELEGGDYYMPLFVVLKEGYTLNEELKEKIKQNIRKAYTPRHVPDEIFEAPAIPRTLNNKKMEVPVKKILSGIPLEKAVNPDSMSNPESIKFYAELAKKLNLKAKL